MYYNLTIFLVDMESRTPFLTPTIKYFKHRTRYLWRW